MNNYNYSHNSSHTQYEEIQITLKLKKNVAFVGRLIAYQQHKSFDEFVSEEIGQTILDIGPAHYLDDNLALKAYALHLLEEGEEEI